MNATGHVTVLVIMLERYKVSLAGITEARLTGITSALVESACVLYSGGDGAALIVGHPFLDYLASWQGISKGISADEDFFSPA